MTIPAEERARPGRRLSYAALIAIALVLVASVGYSAATTSPPVTEKANESMLVGAMGAGHDGGVYQINETGAITWSYTQDAISYNDVSRLESGQILATFQQDANGNVTTGVRIIDQESKTVTWEYAFSVPWAVNHEVHDAEVLPNGNIVIADMGRERVFVVDRDSKQILWQWNASRHYVAPAEPRRTDWLHINDVDYIGDGRFLVSVRNANQLLVVTRGEGVTEVVNADRGDPNDENCRGLKNNQMVGEDPKCGDVAVLNHQHNPQWLGDGRIVVADSENDRVVELARDNETGEWRVAWSDYGAGGVRYDWPRDADRLPNGNTLVLDTRNSRVVEVDENGTLVWATSIPAQGYDADRAGVEYPAGGSYASGNPPEPVEQPSKLVAALHGGIQHVSGGALGAWYGEWQTFFVVVGVALFGAGSMLEAVVVLRREFRVRFG